MIVKFKPVGVGEELSGGLSWSLPIVASSAPGQHATMEGSLYPLYTCMALLTFVTDLASHVNFHVKCIHQSFLFPCVPN